MMARLTLLLSLLTALGMALGWFRVLVEEWRAWRGKKRATGRWLLVLGFVLLAANASDAATDSEQWCRDNAECVCSEPLDATGASVTAAYPASGASTYYRNPSDSTIAPCDHEGITGAAFQVTDDTLPTYRLLTSGEAFTGLPSGHSKTTILATTEGNGGQFLGPYFGGGSVPTARRSMRIYRYYSTNYGELSAGFADCTVAPSGDKAIQIGGPGPIFNFESTPLATSWNNSPAWTPTRDCCVQGPGSNAYWGQTMSQYAGHWLRFEVIVRNASSSGPTILEWWVKDVTAGGANEKWIDTSVVTTQPVLDNWDSTAATTLAANRTINDIWLNIFRNGTCPGWNAMTHMVGAAWSTDAGQMIGAASEIEGGSGGGGGGGGVITLFLRSLAPLATITDLLVMAHLWRYRSQAVKAAVMIWRYAAYPKAWWWTYRYTRAVKRWQTEAPIMLTDQRVQIVEPAKEQDRAIWL